VSSGVSAKAVSFQRSTPARTEARDALAKRGTEHQVIPRQFGEDDLTYYWLLQVSQGRPYLSRKAVIVAWVILVVAGLFEIGWAIGLKYTHGFTRLWPSVWTASAMLTSLWLLGIAMKSLPLGTAYAVWVGVGAVGTVILGIVLLGESPNPLRLVSVGLIVAGIVGLKLATPM
jgi:quaternary ammonium compound-resistance protein SugE